MPASVTFPTTCVVSKRRSSSSCVPANTDLSREVRICSSRATTCSLQLFGKGPKAKDPSSLDTPIGSKGTRQFSGRVASIFAPATGRPSWSVTMPAIKYASSSTKSCSPVPRSPTERENSWTGKCEVATWTVCSPATSPPMETLPLESLIHEARASSGMDVGGGPKEFRVRTASATSNPSEDFTVACTV